MIRASALLALLLLLPGQLAAQSLLARGGLGIPSEALDARARGLGGVGVGLVGWGIFPTDPAAAAGLRLPSITATFQPGTASVDGEGGRSGHTRFPVLGLSYPFGANVFTLTMGSVLDSEWDARSPVVLELAGEEVEGTDIYRSRGGIGQVRVGWARRVTGSLAVGLSAGTQVGSLERTFSRELDPEQVGSDVDPFRTGARWDAAGAVATAGVAWDPSELIRIGGSMAWANGLRLSPVEGSGGESRTFSVPTEYRLGGTGSLSPELALALSMSYADWSRVGDELEDGATRGATWGFGGGVEWTGGSLRDRAMPIRLGYRSQEFPFLVQGEAAGERAFTGGLGIHLADFDDIPVARLEIGIQRGNRDAGDLSERFWRTTVSVRLAGG